MHIVSEKIEQYCEKHTTGQPSSLLQALEKETYEKTAIPQMQVGYLEGAFLKMLVRLIAAKQVLEIGTFTGYSALMMAEGLSEYGRLVTCDIDPTSTEIARQFWGLSPHGKKIELRLGPAIKTLETLQGPFDLVFLDADKENYIAYWEACLPKVRSGGLIVADNVLWTGRVLDPKDKSDHAIVAFNQHVKKDFRVEAVMIPLRDGVTVARKV